MPRYFVGEITYVFIMCVVSLGLMVLVGYTGQVSLGHSAFVAIGAYAHAWLLTQGVPLVASLVLAACITGVIGFVIGLPAIRASFGEMFNSGPIDVHAEKVHRLHTHFGAVHSVLERVQVLTEQGRQSAWVIATNVYLKTALGWRIVAHHASPGTPREAQEILESAAVLH